MNKFANFKLIDHADSVVPNESAEVTINTTGEEFYFADHFPGFPVVPGVIQIEWMAQLATYCLRASAPSAFPVLLSVRRSEFVAPIRPGAECRITVTKTSQSALMVGFHGQVTVNGVKASEASLLIRNWTKAEFEAALGAVGR